MAVAERHADLPALGIRDAILAAVATFSGDRPAEDDLTPLVVRLPPPGHPQPDVAFVQWDVS